MTDSSSHTVTELLGRLHDADPSPEAEAPAEEALYEEVYQELQRNARRQRRRWKGDPTLQTTALAHEAYIRLVDQNAQSWESRSHFFAVASRAMRHILIDHARKKSAEKRGGSEETQSLDELREKLGREVAMSDEDAEAFSVLGEALDRLEAEHARAARGVECRFFGGMTIEETAEALGVSTATVSRDWKQAKAWLYREMKRIRRGGAAPDDDSDDDSESTAEGDE